MTLTLPTILETLLLAGYIFFGIALNFIAYLISLFYQKKFGRNSPKAGFLVSIVLSVFLIISLVAFQQKQQVLHIMSAITLMGSAAGSVFGTINLYYTMKKSSK